MTTIINALKQLKSKGFAFAPLAMPDADQADSEPISDSAPPDSEPDSQLPAEIPDGDATKPNRIATSFVLTVGHAARMTEVTDDRPLGKSADEIRSPAGDAASIGDTSCTSVDTIAAGPDCSFAPSPISDVAWEAERWKRVEVELWRLDESPSNNGSLETCESELTSDAEGMDDSGVLEAADLPEDLPEPLDSEPTSAAVDAEVCEETNVPENSSAADFKNEPVALEQTPVTQQLPRPTETDLLSDASFDDEPVALEQTPVTQQLPRPTETDLLSDASFDDEPVALEQTPVTQQPPRPTETELLSDASFDDEPVALEQTPVTQQLPRPTETELLSDASFDDEPVALQQTPVTQQLLRPTETELLSDASFDDEPVALQQTPVTQQLPRPTETELLSDASFDDEPVALEQTPVTQQLLRPTETDLLSDASFNDEPVALQQTPVTQQLPRPTETDLLSDASFDDEPVALEQTSVTEHRSKLHQTESISEAKFKTEPLALVQPSITVQLPKSSETELASDPRLDDELEALDQTLAFEQLPNTDETKSELTPPDVAVRLHGMSQSAGNIVLDKDYKVDWTDDGPVGKTRPIESDSLWPETADVDWPGVSGSEVDALSSSPPALTDLFVAAGDDSDPHEAISTADPEACTQEAPNDESEADAGDMPAKDETDQHVGKETVASFQEDDQLDDFATVPRIRIEQLKGLDQNVNDSRADEPLLEPGIRDIDGSSGLELTSDFIPASDLGLATDLSRDDSNDWSAERLAEGESPALDDQTAQGDRTAKGEQLADATIDLATEHDSNDRLSTQLPALPIVEPGNDHPADSGNEPEKEDQSTGQRDHVGTDHPVGDVKDNLRAYEQSIVDRLSDESVSDEYARSLHRIVQAFPSGLPAVVLMVGAGPEPDVSETLAYMAMLLVRRDAGQVLLVDANQPKRTLSERFAVGNQPGLSEACRGQTQWQELLVAGTDPSLSILPAGIRTVSPMTAAGTVKRLVDEWKDYSKIVLIDAGDIDAPLTEALARASDSVYILVRLGRTRRDQALATAARLRSVTGRLQGCIVTDVTDVTDVDAPTVG